MKSRILIICLLVLSISNSCKKFLNEKSDKRLATPSTIQDMLAILDNISIMNRGAAVENVSSDDYYLTLTSWNATNLIDKDAYIWNDTTDNFNDWSNLYKIVFYANTVLDNIDKIPLENRNREWQSVKGSAVFFRSHAFFHLAQVFAKQYDINSAQSDLGIPLRLNSDFNQLSVRSTLQETYNQIISDFKTTLELLPENQAFKTRPSKVAAFAMLARTYIVMGDYFKAKENANSCLQINDSLMDYNSDSTINLHAINPFQRFNAEVIFHSLALPSTALFTSRAKIDSNLYLSYDSNDLRRQGFFRPNTGSNTGTFSFKGSYSGENGSESFDGIATNEILLIRSECFAREGNIAAAMSDLNVLMSKRWSNNGSWVAFIASNETEALNKILFERRKELIFRGVRWTDLRRLNKEGANITLKRVLDNTTFTLTSNDLRYTFLIPQDVVNLTGIAQNNR